MTIGIYCLKFNGTDKVYIGQSVNIERRFKQHINSLNTESANIKLQEAYHKYGVPYLCILTECCIEELNNLEQEAILLYDSVSSGLNILDQATHRSSNIGEDSPNSKYSNELILEVFNQLVQDSSVTYQELADNTGMSYTNIRKIVSGDTYKWLKDKYPTEYQVMQNNTNKRIRISRSKGHSAEGRGIKYPSISSPGGIVYSNITNASAFAKINNLSPVLLCKLFKGQVISHKGWKLWVQPEPV